MESALQQVEDQLSELTDRLLGKLRAGRSEGDLLMGVGLALETQRVPLAAALALAIFNVHLLGRAQVYADVHPRLAAATIKIETSFAPLPFEEAIEFFRDKTNVSPERFRDLSNLARAKAFTISGRANQQVRDSIKDLLDKALSEGLTMKEFQDRADEVLDRAGLSAGNPWYWETVYRTNMQTSYQSGRWKQMTDPGVAAERPYIRYVSALLPTSRPSHKEKHGLVYPIDHPFWDTWAPPNGFNCYCQTMSVSPSLLERRGWSVSDAMNFAYPEPDEGWDKNAGKTEPI